MNYIERIKRVSKLLLTFKRNLFLFVNIDGDFEDNSLRLQISTLQNVSFKNMPIDSNQLILQTLRDRDKEIEHLKERFNESITELETRTTFIKKTIKVNIY